MIGSVNGFSSTVKLSPGLADDFLRFSTKTIERFQTVLELQKASRGGIAFENLVFIATISILE